jgi:D-alanyl-D-alanine carboxypeptidase (penicillin-binding protein 5/6)
MLAISGNDAAWALGEHLGGNMPSFVERMNATSKAMGLTRSQWQNPHGLTQEGHMSTAADLAHLAHALWTDFPQARPWLGVKTYTWQGVTQSNRNSLLWRDASVDGLKTGHTEAAGYNLAATSRVLLSEKALDSDYEWRLTSVVLGAASANARAADSAALLAWARAAYTPQRLHFAHAVVGRLAVAGAVGQFEVRPAQAVWVLLPTGRSKANLRQELMPLPNITAPVAVGTAIATLNVYDGATLLASHPLTSALAIDRAPWYRLLWQWVKSLF